MIGNVFGFITGAGDRLMDLTSRDGDWFLDELCSMSSNVKHFIDMLRVNTAVCIHIILYFASHRLGLDPTWDKSYCEKVCYFACQRSVVFSG